MISKALENKIYIYYCSRVSYAYNVIGISKEVEPYDLEFNNRTSSIGLCDYGKKKIFLSTYYIRHMSFELICEVINHELAHWAERRGRSHGFEWQQMAIKFGIEPNRTFSSSRDGAEYPWLIMFKDEIIGKVIKPLNDISSRWVSGRKKETVNQLYHIKNPNIIDNIMWNEL